MARVIENSYTKSNWLVQGMVAALGTTAFKAAGRAATNLDTLAGIILAQRGFVGPMFFPTTSGSTSVGTMKAMACGTVWTAGGATTPIITTGLTTVTHVFMNRVRQNYNTATTSGNVIPQPCLAAGTPSKFYPTVYKVAALGALSLGAAAGATFRWLAVGTM